jgi:hypothetical protein
MTSFNSDWHSGDAESIANRAGATKEFEKWTTLATDVLILEWKASASLLPQTSPDSYPRLEAIYYVSTFVNSSRES